MNRRYRGSHRAAIQGRRRQKAWAQRRKTMKILARALKDLIPAYSDLFCSWAPIFEHIVKGPPPPPPYREFYVPDIWAPTRTITEIAVGYEP
jgi:hypothetical protein